MKLYTRDGHFHVSCKYWDSATGTRKRVQRSTGIPDDGTPASRRVALIVAEDIARGVAVGNKRRVRSISVSDALDAARKAKQRAGRSASTLGILEEKRKQLEAGFGKDRDIATLSDDLLAEYADRAMSGPAPRAPGTVLRELRELVYGLRVLGVVPPKLPDLGRQKPRERALTPEETHRLLAHVSPSRRDHVLMYRMLGLRKSELYAIEPTDINFRLRNVRIRGTKTEDADRVLPLHPDLCEILRRRVQEKREPLFEPWLRGNSDRDLKAFAEAAGLGPISFNDLRRSFATELIMAGESASKVAALLGHTSTRMVDQVYGKLRTEHLDESVAKLDSYLPDPHEEAPTVVVPRASGTGNEEGPRHSYAWEPSSSS